MSTAIMETIELIAPGADVGSTLFTTLMQTTHPESSASLDSLVLAQGKVNSRPTPKAKVVPVVSADALVGDSVYTRPNGEQYHARK